ncbi:MAG: hypothetical protein GMKNLPBB_02020 [Myxococcota bacterium]|nr:hypothetical protein [Myxococcota bacterium]
MNPQKTEIRRPGAIRFLSILAVAAWAAAGCGTTNPPSTNNNNGGDGGVPGDGGNPPIATSSHRLSLAKDCGSIRTRVVDATTEQLLENYFGQGMMRGGMEDAAGGAPTAAPGEKSKPDDYTKTNVQEEGVDEDDFVKTDGEHIYLLQGADLVILKSWPADKTSEIARYRLGDNGNDRNTWGQSMFLHKDRLAVFSQVYEYPQHQEGREYNPEDYFYGTRVTVLNIKDRAKPVLERKIDIEGWLTGGRMVSGQIYAISNAQIRAVWDFWSDLYNKKIINLPERTWKETKEELKALKDAYRPVFRAYVTGKMGDGDVTRLFPRRRTYNSEGKLTNQAPLYACTDLYLPEQITQLGFLNLTHFNLEGEPVIRSIGLMAQGWELYASTGNLYVALSSRWWWWGWGGDQDHSQADIHKFKMRGPNGDPVYEATGVVDGWILNQFSMSEYNDHLRVATTDNRWEAGGPRDETTDKGGNHIIVLKQEGRDLAITGQLRNLAPGERIFAARMMGPKGYLVTFRNVDPLFTLDLSDPANPRKVGELKIPGFSSYIHPMGENHLLTIGQDADDQGVVTGMHLQVFDVSNFADPKRTHQFKISTGRWSSWSEAMWDHKAFTYHPVKKVLGIPLNIYDWSEDGTSKGEHFSGLALFKASADGFQEIGRVNHTDMVNMAYCKKHYGEWACNTPNEYPWWTSMRRSIFIEDYVYSISNVGVKVNDLLNPKQERARVVTDTAEIR